MKNTLFIYLIILNQILLAQSPPSSGDNSGFDNISNLALEAPNLMPASADVASLMRFEEIPVNGYTGIPNISIPIHVFQSQSKKINIELSLNYHATSIGVEEVAPSTGLGWSLMAGGSISRTVRGYPDEIHQYSNTQKNTKFGIYYRINTSNPGSNYNYYYEAEANRINNGEVDQKRLQRFKWNGYEKGMYDTEHDLYQYNFMGISGRFYLRLNIVTNQLEAIHLDENTQNKIEVYYTGPFYNGDNGHVFLFEGFKITDDKGIQYIFKDIETVTQVTNTTNIFFDNLYFNISDSNPMEYPNAFHLTKILDENGVELVKFNYNSLIENTVTKQVTENESESGDIQVLAGGMESELYPGVYGANIQRTEPKKSISKTYTSTETKKISKIIINNIGTVSFSYTAGRTDTNLPENNGFVKLNQIVVEDLNGNQLKNFELDYGTFTVKNYTPENIDGATNRLERLILKEVKEYGAVNSLFNQYTLEYKNEDSKNSDPKKKNSWGYFEIDNNQISGKQYCTTGVLETMILPTGGKIVFDFESSTYSYIGSQLIGDFSSNPENIGLDPNSNNYKNYLYGGGIRIKKISFFEDKNSSIPSTIKRYEYKEFDDVNEKTSSGSLVSYEPVFKFSFGKETVFKKAHPNHNHSEDGTVIYYESKTTFNSLSFVRTHGTDVGYKFVRITSVNPTHTNQKNGKTENIYRAPQDFPEYFDEQYPEDYQDLNMAIYYPFIALRNFDHRRGQLKESRIYDNNNLLKTLINQFQEENENLENTGLKLAINNGGGCGKAYLHKDFDTYIYKFNLWYNGNGNGNGGSSKEICTKDKNSGWPVSHVLIHPIQEASGWNQLVKTTTEEYFYEGNNQSSIESVQNFTYNNLNKQIQTQTTITSLGETLKVEYKFPHDLLSSYDQSSEMQTLVNQNRIAEPIITKTYNNLVVTSEKRVLFNNFNGKLLPEFVYIKKGEGTSAADNKITYVQYDAKGNLQQYELADGIPVSIIWGYNGQYPIAKVEGLSYGSIESKANFLIDQSNSGNLKATDFESLRTMTGGMVTGYIYKPLVGVTTIIQANGQIEYYEYDNFGRLKQIKDHYKNVLKEIEYHYQTEQP